MIALPRFPFSFPRRSHWRAVGVSLLVPASGALHAATAFSAADAADFTDRHCSSCHNDVDKEGGLDLTSLQFTPADASNFQTWVKIHDRVQNGEMPPKEKKRPAASEVGQFVGNLSTSLIANERELVAREGRAMRRRVNRSEYESMLRDLLQAPWLQVKDQFPEDGEAFRFNKVSVALDVSYVHMSRYMAAADYALRQAMSVQWSRPETTTRRYPARADGNLSGFYFNVFNPMPERLKFPVLGQSAQPEIRAKRPAATAAEPEPGAREEEAVGWTSSNYVTGFGSSWSSFRAPVAGRYRLKFSGYTLWVGPGGYIQKFANGSDPVGSPGTPEWFRPNLNDVSPGRRYEPITVYAKGPTSNRRIGGFDVTPEPGVSDLGEIWLGANEFLVTDSTRFFRSRPAAGSFPGAFTNPLAQRDGAPAVAFRWMEVEGPIYDQASAAGYRLLFGDLPMKRVEPTEPGVPLDVVSAQPGRGRGGRGGGNGLSSARVDVVSANPDQDAERLLRAFMARAYRRPVAASEVPLFLGLVQQRLKAGLGFAGAMLAGYTAVLASPEYVFLDEKPGRLEDHALATRLALFLWNSEPDQVLRERADRGELHRPEVLRSETERMLDDPKARRFVDAFLDYWLEIRRMEDTTPSTTLYNDYYLDDSLTEAALDETRLFFADLLRDDRPARTIIDSDFTYLNDRLAAHYGIPGVEGVAMRRVALPAGSVRGGFMTQASVLKVTANGTTTSPVLRGKWIVERIIGHDLPLPPAAVPAVEPDIRGATTIRQQLDKHRADESCATCHRKIDPAGFALESFDVLGGWRDRYRAMAVNDAPAPGIGKNGWPFGFYFAQPVDASGTLPDGGTFQDIRDFKKLLLAQETQIARNFARQLSVYATGAPVRFSDRAAIEKILSATEKKQHGVRSILHALVQSELFLNK